MTLDGSLEALRRAATLAPDDATAHLALGVALGRAGETVAAGDALYRAQALAGDAAALEALAASGLPPSPWPTRDGPLAADRWRCSPLRGPRRGEVVVSTIVRTPGEAILGPDGRLLLFHRPGRGASARWRAHDLATLEAGAVLGDDAGRPLAAPAVAPRGLLLQGGGKRGGAEVLRLVAPSGEELARGEVVDGIGALVPLGDGRVLVQTRPARRERTLLHLLSKDLQRVATCDCSLVGVVLRVHEGTVAWIHQWGPFEPSTLRVVGLDRLELLADVPFAPGTPSGGLLHVERDAKPRPLGPGPFGRDVALPSGTVAWRIASPEALALSPDGALVAFDAASATIVRRREGEPGWSAPFGETSDEVVVDRDGVAYFCDRSEKAHSFVALDRSGRTVFRLSGSYRPLAIDGLGRVLALHVERDAVPELVAIA